jgi:hypothetical protein
MANLTRQLNFARSAQQALQNAAVKAQHNVSQLQQLLKQNAVDAPRAAQLVDAAQQQLNMIRAGLASGR